MKKYTYLYIDDVIWLFRDLTRKRPVSMFEQPFLAMLKRVHEKYGIRIQLNIFYRTDPFYGNDEFCLTEMTDAYKKEWEDASDWLRLHFHAKQEFPDYPYINASYENVKNDYEAIRNEVYRFASPKNWGRAAVPHWRPISKEGCQALFDCGVKVTSATTGERREYDGDPSSLPYGHAARLLHNRKPETAIFTRKTLDIAIANSLCAHNHLSEEELAPTLYNLGAVKDKETGLYFKTFLAGPVHNLSSKENIKAEMESYVGNEYIGWGSHEQYFYPEYFAYQPDYEEKLMLAAQVLFENGYEYVFVEDIIG